MEGFILHFISFFRDMRLLARLPAAKNTRAPMELRQYSEVPMTDSEHSLQHYYKSLQGA